MAGTRTSARIAASSSPQSSQDTAGTKRKADDSSPSSVKSKRGRPSKAPKEQKTLEETMPAGDDRETKNEPKDAVDEKMDDGDTNGLVEGSKTEQADIEKAVELSKAEADDAEAPEPAKDAPPDSQTNGETNAFDQVKADEGDAGITSKEEETKEEESAPATTGEAVEVDKEREKALPSNILEKGVIYFFTRGRVGVEDPDSVQDLQRSFFVLRPLPEGAKLTDGAVQDVNTNRLIAIPKKVWPKSGKDRFMAFVEQAKTSMKDLKESFFQGSDYSTQTVGTRHTPEVTPIGEGVYAITSTGGGQGTTHLVYMLTIPQEIGEVQKDVGLTEKGSFVLSLKNPKVQGPANAQLPQSPDYPQEFFDEFRGRGWMPVHPKHLDYANAQMLLIGENFESSSNLDETPKDAKDDAKVAPQEELEKLEHEDELRVEHLKGDDTIFADLGISSKDYPKVMTTW